MTVIVEALSALAEDPDTMGAMAEQLAGMIDQVLSPQPFPSNKTSLLRDSAEAALFEAADTLNGGFGPLPRYWQPGLWDFIATRLEQSDCPASIRKQAEKTLLAAITGASWDQLGGGVFRATADLNWATCLAANRPVIKPTPFTVNPPGPVVSAAGFPASGATNYSVGMRWPAWPDGIHNGRGALAPPLVALGPWSTLVIAGMKHPLPRSLALKAPAALPGSSSRMKLATYPSRQPKPIHGAYQSGASKLLMNMTLRVWPC